MGRERPESLIEGRKFDRVTRRHRRPVGPEQRLAMKPCGKRLGGVLVAVALSACATDSSDAWQVLPDADAQVFYYEKVAADSEKRIRIDVEKRVLVEGTPDDPTTLFFRAFDLGVDRSHRIHVYDAGNHRVQVFGPDGTFLRTIGGTRGEGPGEFGMGGRIAVAGQTLIYGRAAPRLVLAWDLPSATYRSTAIVPFGVINNMAGTDGGQIVLTYNSPVQSARRAVTFASIRPDGEELHRFASHPAAEQVSYREGNSWANTLLAVPRPDFAFTKDGRLYFAPGRSYEVGAVDVETATQRWIIRVRDARDRVTAADRTLGVETARKVLPNATAEEIEWPEFLPALSVFSTSYTTAGQGHAVRVDGVGRLYVFPHVRKADESGYRPVDIYSRDGERLLLGLVPDISWISSRDDYIYGIEMNASTEEQMLVRYRLLLPEGR